MNEAVNLGIECFVKVTSNKVDEAKDDIRSICLNFDPHVNDAGDEKIRIGTGNNLNINNMKPFQYNALCKALGVKAITEETEIVAVIYRPKDKAKLEEWAKQRARNENDIDESQGDITEDPDQISAKQKKFIGKLRETKVDGDEVYQKILEAAMPKVESVNDMNRDQASGLIDQLQLLEDKPAEPVKNHKPLDATEKKKPGKKPAAKKK